MLSDPQTPGRLVRFVLNEGVTGELYGIDYAVRVTRGIAHLDEKAPTWWRTDHTDPIDLRTLDVGDGNRCVSAQLSGEDYYFSGMSMLGLTPTKISPDGMGVVLGTYLLYGFDAEMPTEVPHVHDYSITKAYRVLTLLWKNVIRARRGDPVSLTA